ncbi:tol-pal system protein YbgF [Phenylobacterium sp.]|uniref:tol-pal system protein YbgF n=1 Tax=Phenylobacterium sp. TaxID=1871053 RepID=UPI002F40A582
MRLRRLLLPATAVAFLTLAAPAVSQTPMDDPLDARDGRRLDRMEKVVRELRAIVYQGRDTGKPVVVQPAETDYQIQEMTRRVNDLEQSLTRLNGQIESLTHDLDQARRAGEAAQAQNKALTDRLTVLEQRAAQAEQPPAAMSDAAAPPPAAAGPSAAEAFAQARKLMLTGDYDTAERAWEDYVSRFGDSPKAPEARYWLGKTLAVRGAHADAAAAYIGAIRGWPQTSWAPDALVDLSRELVALKKPAAACQMLAEFDRRYPKAMPAAKSRAVAVRGQAKCA